MDSEQESGSMRYPYTKRKVDTNPMFMIERRNSVGLVERDWISTYKEGMFGSGTPGICSCEYERDRVWLRLNSPSGGDKDTSSIRRQNTRRTWKFETSTFSSAPA